jgi:hypothetical protein
MISSLSSSFYTFFYDYFSTVKICGTVPQIQPALHIVRLQYVAVTVHGIVCFFLFCHDREIYSGWREVYKKVRGRVSKRGRDARREGAGVNIALGEVLSGSGGTTNASDGTTNGGGGTTAMIVS